MFFSLLIMVFTLGQVDPAELVKQLGSARYSERQEAFDQLGKLAGDALPVLRAAASSTDAEVRVRVSELIDQIESRILVEPTLVTLDFRDRPLAEILSALGERSGTNLVLFPEVAGGPGDRRFTLESEKPVSFWEALERVCGMAQLQIQAMPIQVAGLTRAANRPTLQLTASTEPSGPSAISGPFRASVVGVSVHRDRTFGGGGIPGGGVFVNANGQPMRVMPKKVDGAPGRTSESFSVGVQLAAEPRLSLQQRGICGLMEVKDERGRSLKLSTGDADGGVRPFVSPTFMGNGGGVIQFTIPLELPEDPGRWIHNLKAELPVTVLSRKVEPFVVNLRDAKGKRFEEKGLILTIHDIRPEPMQNATLLDLTIRFRRDDGDQQDTGPFGSPEFLAFRHNPGQPNNQVEFVDAEGRPLLQWFAMSQQPTNEGLQLSLRIVATDGVGAPAALRFYEMVKTETTISFELKEIPMP